MLRGSNFCPLECPGYYEPIIHTIGIISTVCNAFGIYLTLTKSKKNTRYRFCQLYVQVTSLLTEFDLSIVNPAYFFFPMIGGMNCGPMREFQVKFGVTSHICITFFAFIFCLQVPALLTCFMYRHQAAAKCSPDKTWSLSKLQCLSLLFIYHMFPVLIAFSLYHSGLTMEEKKISMAIVGFFTRLITFIGLFLLQNYPDCFPSLEDFTFDFYDYKLNPTFVAFGILISVYYVMAGVIGFGLAWRTGQVLNRYRYIMSARTYQLHKSSLITLTTQVTGPTLVLGIPVFTVYIVVASQMTKLHVLASTAPFFICMHSAVTTGCLIMTTSTYKTFVMKYYEIVKAKLTWKKIPIVIVAASPVVNVRPIGSGIHTFF